MGETCSSEVVKQEISDLLLKEGIDFSSSIFAMPGVTGKLVETGYIAICGNQVDHMSLAKFVNDYVWFSTANSEEISRRVHQPESIVYGKLLEQMARLEHEKIDGVKRLYVNGEYFLCPTAALDRVLFGKTTHKKREKPAEIRKTVAAIISSPEKVIYDGVKIYPGKMYTREEIFTETPISQRRLQLFVYAGVLPNTPTYDGKDICAVLKKLQNCSIIDELLEDELGDDKEKFEIARSRIYQGLKNSATQTSYGAVDIGKSNPLFVVERERFEPVITKICKV